ncbi:tRNA (cytosine(38)-C(5))-methyltransferase-like [Haliotis rufescens]|uniref:tRNA (cytosine(38)-C(5))-methyltransferase-like n=1 Tax=Haliotis rufescens TaxID=6454 RepID=UPI00201EE323|nr:tRNA (cytosine(38)-C(5))-methyltransferase-like [Haliotis rufescens]
MAAPVKVRVLELYSGIGGMHWALQESGLSFEVVAAIDINTTANQIYRHNFPDVKLLPSSIDKLTVAQFEAWNIDAVLMSPPCQPFTRMGKKRDVEDIRTKSFMHVLHLISVVENKPRYILVENVKGFETSAARQRLVETLRQCSYSSQEFLLTPLQTGVPNCRLRYYLIATLAQDGFTFPASESILEELPAEASDWLTYKTLICDTSDQQSCDQSCDSGTTPGQNGGVCDANEKTLEDAGENLRQVADETHQEYSGCQRLKHFIEKQSCEYFQEFLLDDKELTRFVIMDIVQPSLKKSACFTRRYGHFVEGAGSIVQMTSDGDAVRAVSKLKSRVVDLPERPLLGEEELDLLRGLQLRYFTPREIANLLCFPPQFELPNELSRIQMYRSLGNSLSVHVVSLLIRLMTL